MGQTASYERTRDLELNSKLIPAAVQRATALQSAAAAEQAAGIAAAPGSKQALYQAAHKHVLQLFDESDTIAKRLSGCP